MTGVERAKMYPLDHRGHESFLVIIVFFIAFGVVIALLLLGGWNMYLVSRAETAIEFYTNKRDAMEKKRSGKVSEIFNITLYICVCTMVVVIIYMAVINEAPIL